MIDETNTPESRAASGGGAPGTERAGFCQQCGRALTTDSLRRVGNGIFCEPCAGARAGTAAAPGWTPVNAARPAGTYPRIPASPGANEPNPVLAGFLGLIPGVGAMYNGQYPKGVVHLIVFVVLVALADNSYWGIWWLVWGWIFYQAFEAYHTAQARRDGLPLPNPFGWNDLGDRLGFSRTLPPVGTTAAAAYPNSARYQTSQPDATSASAGVSGWAAAAEQASQAATPPPPPMPAAEVPYAPYARPVADVSDPPTQASFTPPTQVPYAQTYTGFDQAAGNLPGSTPASGSPAGSTRRFPTGAVWLIGLGALFLLGNLLPEWRLNGRWLVPALLAALALWTATRRIEVLRSSSTGRQPGSSWVAALLAPVLLLTVAGLLALQDAGALPLRRSWPILLVVWGAMLLAQRLSEASFPGTAEVEARSASSGAPAGSGPLGL